jgi:imidazolonepropionase-like amidohydrolase
MTHPLLVQNATVLDPVSGTYAETDLLLADGRVVDAGSNLRAPAEAELWDARGGYVLPGLVDCHVHVAAYTADLASILTAPSSYVALQSAHRMGEMLNRGFTTVRDTGGGDWGLARAQQEGLIRAPRLYYGGRGLSQTGGHGDKYARGERRLSDQGCCTGTGRVADGVDAVRLAARDELRKGARHIKVHASGGVSSPDDHVASTQYSMDELRAAVEEATAAGRYVTAHAYPAAAINRALEAGVRCIEHGNLLDDTSLELLKRYDAWLVPTLVTYSALKNEGLDHGLPLVSWHKVDDVLHDGLTALERAHNAGVNLAYGTDLLGGMNARQCEEFRIRREVQPAIDVIRAATSNAAELLDAVGQLGTLAVGALGDLIVVDADPTEDIEVLAQPEQHLRLVVQAGAVVARPRP